MDFRRNIELAETRLPETLKKHRISARFSTTDLANVAGLTERTVRDLENSKKKRTQEKTVLLLARALNVTYDELLGRETSDAGSHETSDFSSHEIVDARSPSSGEMFSWRHLVLTFLAGVVVTLTVVWLSR